MLFWNTGSKERVSNTWGRQLIIRSVDVSYSYFILEQYINCPYVWCLVLVVFYGDRCLPNGQQ